MPSFKFLFQAVVTSLIVISSYSFGQGNNNFNVILKFHPSAIVALSRPTILGSVEFNYKRIGIDLAYGQQFGFWYSSNPDTLRVNNFGNQYRADLRYYLNPLEKDKSTTPFFGMGYCKMYTQKNITVHWFSGYQYNPSVATINNIHACYFTYGLFSTTGRLRGEAAVSGGIRNRTEEAVYANKIVYNKATRNWVHLSLSIRICYALIQAPDKKMN